MNLEPRSRIASAFSHATAYDDHATVQRRAAEDLAERIAALDLPGNPRILEIGCGTGFLTEALVERGLAGEWWVTDLSAAMLERCRERLARRAPVRFAVLDGEYGEPPVGGPFDLICSNLAFQWFDDLDRAVSRLLAWLSPGGHLVFSTLASETFREWRLAHHAEGCSPGAREFPAVAALRQVAAAHQVHDHAVRQTVEHFASAREFLKSVKAIGAGTPSRRHRALRPAELKKVMRRFERTGSAARYEIVSCHYRAPERPQ